MSLIQIVLSRVIGGIVASICAWLALKTGLIVDQTQQAELVEKIIALMLVVFSVLYPLLHKFIGRYTNPGDAASPEIATKEASEQRVLDHGGI